MIYWILNYFFFGFHTCLIFFNVFGWIFRKTRRWNLLTLIITAFSWFLLGIWYGWGYCLCTDWHWEVRRHLGFHDSSRSYIHFLLLEMTGRNFPPDLVEQLTGLIFFICLFLSLVFNIRDWKKKRLIKNDPGGS
mgnify:CR=1 FL=1